MYKHCPKCHKDEKPSKYYAETLAEDTYCRGCGTELVEFELNNLSCDCGQELHNKDKYCAKCGVITEYGKKEEEKKATFRAHLDDVKKALKGVDEALSREVARKLKDSGVKID